LPSDWADLSEFDKQFENNTKAMPIVKQTQQVTKIDGRNKTEINLVDAKIRVTQFEVRKGGVFSSARVYFQVETEIPGAPYKYLVHRKDSDFYALRKVMVQMLTYTMVPPLPIKAVTTNATECEKRQ
jgi:hypothetical protein